MDRISKLVAICCLLGVVLLSPPRAQAHTGFSGPRQAFTQTVGPYTLVVTLEQSGVVPGPLFVDIVPQGPLGDATLRLRAVPRGQPFTNAPVAEVRASDASDGLYYAQLQVDRTGDWEIEVRAEGSQGSGVSRIPFTVATTPMPLSSVLQLAAVGALVLWIVVAVLLSVIAHRRRREVPKWTSALMWQALYTCILCLGIFSLLQFLDDAKSASAATQANQGIVTGGRPHVNVVAQTTPATPQAGQPITLTLALSDGSTGLLVDDLVSHHEALMHLVVIDASGAFFAHLHPTYDGAGRYSVGFTPDRPGRYTAYVEVARQESGSQIAQRTFTVGGAGPATPAQPAPGLGMREVNGLQVRSWASQPSIRAGRQTTLTFSFAQGGQPVTTMQPWLGMAGHLIARSADEAIYAHVHAAEPMAPPGFAAQGVRYGPDVRFVYTFPVPGRYQLWAQFRHNDAIVTVPLTLEVQP